MNKSLNFINNFEIFYMSSSNKNYILWFDTVFL